MKGDMRERAHKKFHCKPGFTYDNQPTLPAEPECKGGTTGHPAEPEPAREKCPAIHATPEQLETAIKRADVVVANSASWPAPQPDPVQRVVEAWHTYSLPGGVCHRHTCDLIFRHDGAVNVCTCGADELTAALDTLGANQVTRKLRATSTAPDTAGSAPALPVADSSEPASTPSPSEEEPESPSNQ